MTFTSYETSSACDIAFPGAASCDASRLVAFWPEHRLVSPAEASLWILPEDAPAPPGQMPSLRYAAGPLRSPRFNGRRAPVALLVQGNEAPQGGTAALERGRAVAARIAAERIGGEPGLPDPGATGLGLPLRDAVLILDPCDPAGASAARKALEAGLTAARGRTVLLARDPAAPAEAVSQLQPPAGARVLASRLAPWTLLDLAADLHGASPEMALLAAAAGVPVGGEVLDPGPPWAALIAATRCADPFLHRPWRLEQALDQLAAWRVAQQENRRVAVCFGIAAWKRQRVAALFAHAGGAPDFVRRPRQAIAAAKRQGGAVAAWAGAMPAGFREACAREGVPVLTVEDGFVRSRGLGARFLPGAAYAVDDRGVYYDPARPSALEHLLATADFPPDLLARAAALRQAIVARGVTKYNLTGAAPVIAAAPDRPRLLVPGQVEDDASVRLGGGAIRGNLALLKAVRAAHPGAFIIYKPHPDLEAGFRKGRLNAEILDSLADQVVTGAPLTALFPQMDAVHTLTSLSGFEALLRGVPVVTWGQPFYAGWGLTEDRNPPPRRGRALSLDALVAAALILFPRHVDPVTELPCPPEVILERLDDPSAWKLSPFTLHRGFEGWLRGTVARLRRWR